MRDVIRTAICFRTRILLVGIGCCLGLFQVGRAVPEAVDRRAGNLRTVLRQADEAYQTGQPIMSDEAYDALQAQYELLCEHYPELPGLSAVGAPVPAGAERVAHSRPMRSLKKVFSDAELAGFARGCGAGAWFCIEPKIDGVSILLTYLDGQLHQALTRGDGIFGMDATRQLMASGAVPLQLTNAPARVEVRGELFFTHDAFAQLNRQRGEMGDQPLASPRNAAAGTLRLKDLSEVARRGLDCRAFELVFADTMPETHATCLERMAVWGLPVVESRRVRSAEMLPAVAMLHRQMDELPFPADGIVIRLDDRAAFERMGSTARYPHAAVARKYPSIPHESRLLRVEWLRSDQGRLTPVACFEPVEIGGAVVQRASLHSPEHLCALDLMIGDRILVIRAGGSIPQVIGRSPRPRDGSETPVPVPD